MQLSSIITILSFAAHKAIAAPLNTTTTLPTHFGLFMYSLDGKIVDQTLYAPGQPCIKNITSSLSTIDDEFDQDSYGAYAFSIGPRGYLFAHLDGRIATCSNFGCIGGENYFGGTSQVILQAWSSYYKQPALPAIPTCGIAQDTCEGTFFLECEVANQTLIWSYCGTNTDASGVSYTIDLLSWSTVIAPGCVEVDVQVVEVPKFWGNQTASSAVNCTAYTDV